MRKGLRPFAYVASLLMLGASTWTPGYAQPVPQPGGGGGSSASAPFSDATALVKNGTDATKTFKVDASGLTTANDVVMTLTGTAAAPTWTATGWTMNIGSGTAGAPALAWAADADGSGTGFYRNAADQISVVSGGSVFMNIGGGGQIRIRNDRHVGFASGDPSSTAIDTGIRRLAAGVLTQTGATGTSIGALLGGGGAVASADPLPAFTGNVFHVTGTTSFTNFTTTNFVTGACATLIFDGVLTVTDGGNMKLAGNFVTTADDTLTVCYDGTNFYEVARSVN